ncbi:MAG: hypothetical protein JWP92_2373 [Caulobacter sp.]|jgi:hypothetical protein|nr:hypothetical protein [Caulobacter sp.]
MLLKTLALGAALTALVAASATAGPTSRSGGAIASPKQPIPYSQLNAYLKASPKQRATKDWWSGSASASTGMSADTAASVPANERATTDSLPSTPPTNTPDATTTQPAPGSMQPGGEVKDPSVEPK